MELQLPKLNSIKMNLKKEMVDLKKERERFDEKSTENNDFTYLKEMQTHLDKLIKERKMKIKAINKRINDLKNQNEKTELKNSLKNDILSILSKNRKPVLSCDLLKGREGRMITGKFEKLGVKALEDFIEEMPEVASSMKNNTPQYWLRDVGEDMGENHLDGIANIERKHEMSEVQNVIFDILAECPGEYISGNDLKRTYRKRTGKRLRIDGYDGVNHFFENISGVDCSIRGYRVTKKSIELFGKAAPTSNGKKVNRKVVEKVLAKVEKEYENLSSFSDFERISKMSFKTALEQENELLVIKTFLGKIKNKTEDWSSEISSSPVADLDFIVAVFEFFSQNNNNTNEKLSIIEDLLTAMYRFEYPVTRRVQQKLTKIYQIMEPRLSGEIKMAMSTTFFLKNILTESEKRIILNKISEVSKLNWLNIEWDKKGNLAKIRRVEKLIKNSVVIDLESISRRKFGDFLKDFQNGVSKINEKLKLCFLRCTNEENLNDFKLVLDEKLPELKDLSEKKICPLFNSSICPRNVKCSLFHICAFCGSGSHNLNQCLDF